MTEAPKINRGLMGVHFDRSAVSEIDGAADRLYKHGYMIDDLATNATFEEVAHLLITGEPPSADELADFDARLNASRVLPDETIDIVRATSDGHPMNVLRTAVSALAALESGARDALEVSRSGATS